MEDWRNGSWTLLHSIGNEYKWIITKLNNYLRNYMYIASFTMKSDSNEGSAADLK